MYLLFHATRTHVSAHVESKIMLTCVPRKLQAIEFIMELLLSNINFSSEIIMHLHPDYAKPQINYTMLLFLDNGNHPITTAAVADRQEITNSSNDRQKGCYYKI